MIALPPFTFFGERKKKKKKKTRKGGWVGRRGVEELRLKCAIRAKRAVKLRPRKASPPSAFLVLSLKKVSTGL